MKMKQLKSVLAATSAALCLFSSISHAAPRRGPSALAVRVGWAYGLGAEVEFRPHHWGIGVSGGLVPGYGSGGYAGVQWGDQRIGTGGWVAEGGLFHGQQSPLRLAPTGLGAYAMGGREFAPNRHVSVRFVGGAGVPFGRVAKSITYELLAKLTAGVVF
jgi:hypothetical protein